MVAAFCSYLGGSGWDNVEAPALDSSGAAVVTGITGSSDSPLNNAFQGTFPGENDVFLTKFTPNGQGPVFSTYFGGDRLEDIKGLVIANNSIFTGGMTMSSNLPVLQSLIKKNTSRILKSWNEINKTFKVDSEIRDDYKKFLENYLLSKKKILIITLTVIAFFTAIVVVFYFYIKGSISYKEIRRISSPDTIVDAVLVEVDGGATTSKGYHLYLVPKGSNNFQKDSEDFIADHVIDFDIRWRESNFLEIKYKQARIFHFSNFWHSDKIKNWSYVVELRLVPLTDSFSLSKSDRWIQ